MTSSHSQAQLSILGLIFFVLWLFEKSFWLRCIAAVFHVWKMLQWVKTKGKLGKQEKKEVDKDAIDDDFWMLLNASLLAFFAYLSWGVIWSSVVVLVLAIATSQLKWMTDKPHISLAIIAALTYFFSP